MPVCANRPGRSEIHPRVKGGCHPSRPHEQKAHHQQEECGAARDDNALSARPSKAQLSDRRPVLRTQQKPLRRRGRGHDQGANENPPLPAIAPEDRRRAMKEAEEQEQAQHQTKPVGSPLNPG
jgi:hypothetical protein